jgi:uncharacterized membrane protein
VDGGRFARPEAPRPDLEDLLGGRVLAWVGGFAVLAGLAFLLTIAISRGWLGEAERTLLAGVLSAGLLAVGVRLRERRDRTDAALAAAAVGIAGLFGTLVVAGAVYHLIPVSVALFAAYGVGALATVLAARWDARAFAWLGLLGALWAPATLGALNSGGITFLAIAYASTVGVLVWRRWHGLAWAAFFTSTVQWLFWIYVDGPSDRVMLLTLVTFGALTAKLAFGLELRERLTSPTAVVLIGANAFLLAAVGAERLDAGTWLFALAAAHFAAGLVATRVTRISREFALVTLGVGVLIADAGVATLGDDLAIMLIWVVGALPFAALLGARPRPTWVATLRHSRPEDWPRDVKVARAANAVLGRGGTADWIFAALGLVTQLGLALSHLLADEAPLSTFSAPAASTTALVALGATCLVAFAAARIADRVWAPLLDALALAALAAFTAAALSGLELTLALAAQAVLLSFVARPAGIAFAGLALLHALSVEAPLQALVDGLEHPLSAVAALGAVTAALAVSTRSKAVTALSALYLASALAVTLGGEHTGQTFLSVLWALSGVGTLVYGLVQDERDARRGALVLLLVTAAKVFLYDLAELDSLARVASFIGFGLLLLMGAFAYQRVRPYSETK